MPLIHEALTYQIRGILFDVYNSLGPNLPEAFYRDACAIDLEQANIVCQTEKQFDVYYRGVEIGRYYLDIWLPQNKLCLELKVVPELLPLHQAQAISYLKITNADLALLINFGSTSLVAERLPNFLRNKQPSLTWQPQTPKPNQLYPELTNHVLAALHQVHVHLGPGFFHQIYRRATMVELREQNIPYQYIKETPIYYKNCCLGTQPTRLIHADNKILIAAIAVNAIDASMVNQLKARMRQLNVRLAILANFNSTRLQFKMVR